MGEHPLPPELVRAARVSFCAKLCVAASSQGCTAFVLRADRKPGKHQVCYLRGNASVSACRPDKRFHLYKGVAEFDYERYWRDAWSRAKEALRELKAAEAQKTRRWPRVYIYKLQQPLSDWSPEGATSEEVFGANARWGDWKTRRQGRGVDWSVASANDPWEAATSTAAAPQLDDKHAESSLEKQQQLPPLWWRGVSYTRRTTLARHAHDSNQYSFAQALLYRLWHSPRYRTLDPTKADVFLVPARAVWTSTHAVDTAVDDSIARSLSPYPHTVYTHSHTCALLLRLQLIPLPKRSKNITKACQVSRPTRPVMSSP